MCGMPPPHQRPLPPGYSHSWVPACPVSALRGWMAKQPKEVH